MKEYKNRNWLYYQYIDLKQSTIEIGKICNCNNRTIWNWLKKLNIPIRSISESRNLIKKQYHNKKWIEHQYIKLEKSIGKISVLCNCSNETIWKWLKRFNIPIRTLSEAGKIAQNRPETRKRRSESHQGKYRGILSGNWKGNQSNYYSNHSWIRKYKPKPKICERCNQEKELQLSNISGDYKRDINDYEYLCIECHRKHEKTLTNKRFIQINKGSMKMILNPDYHIKQLKITSEV